MSPKRAAALVLSVVLAAILLPAVSGALERAALSGEGASASEALLAEGPQDGAPLSAPSDTGSAGSAPDVAGASAPLPLDMAATVVRAQAAALPLAGTEADEGGWVATRTSTPSLEVKGGTRTTSAKPKEGDWYTDSSGDLHISGSAPLSIRTSGASDQFTSQEIEVDAGTKADLTFCGVRIETGGTYSPMTLFTNLKGTAMGATATSGDQIVNKTEVHLTLAPYSDNILRQRVKSTVGSGAPALRCGEGNVLVIDDAVRNEDAAGGMITPEGGVVPAAATLSNGTQVKAGDPLSVLEQQGPDVAGIPAIGRLRLEGGYHGAALGGDYYESSGTIIINGGLVDAHAAAINGDTGDNAKYPTLSVSYTGSTKDRRILGNHGGAAIGGGVSGSGTLTIINGGRVIAQSSFHGAGIGAGIGYKKVSGPSVKSDALNSPSVPVTVGGDACMATVGGDIRINGGYVEAKGGGHGNAIGASCSLNQSSNTDHIIKVTGGTLEMESPSLKAGSTAAPATYDIGGKGGHVIITGGSVKVNGSSKFQGYDGGSGLAYNTHDVDTWDDIEKNHPDTADLLPASDQVFMLTCDLKGGPDGVTDNGIVSFKLRLGDEPYPYGAPAEFNDGKLYLWLPKWVKTQQKEVAIDLVVDKDGEAVDLGTFYIPGDKLSGGKVKRYRTFEIPEDYPLSKDYDGLPYNPLTLGEGSEIVYMDPETGSVETLDDPTRATFRYRMLGEGGDEGTWLDADAFAMPTDACTFDVEVTSTEYAETYPFSNSFWGHRATGTAEIRKVPADVMELRAVWLDAEGRQLADVYGDELRARAATLRLVADVTSGKYDEQDSAGDGAGAGDPMLTANTCASPLGSVSVMMGDTAVGTFDMDESTSSVGVTARPDYGSDEGCVVSRQSWIARTWDGMREHTVVTCDVPKETVYALLDAGEPDADYLLSVSYDSAKNYLDVDSVNDGESPRVIINRDGLEDPNAVYTVTTAAEPAEGGTVAADAESYRRREAASVTVTPADAAGWRLDALTVDGTVIPWSRLEGLLPEAGEDAPDPVAGYDFTVTGGAGGTFTVSFPAMKRNHEVSATFAKRTYAAAASVRGGAGGTAAVTARNDEELAAPAQTLTATHGDRLTFSWEAEEGWRVADILVNGERGRVALADAGSWECPAVTGPVSFEVVCERRLYTVAVSGEPSEGGTVSGGGSVAYGDDATVGYAPAEGWHVETLTVDGVPWPPASYPAGLTLRKVGTNHQVEVGFRRSMYPFALTVSDEAGGTVSGPTLVEHGRDATVAWEAAPGWQVTAVTVDGASRAPAEFGDAGAGRLVFEKTDGPHRVHVTVEKRTYAVTAVVAAGNGAVSPGEAKVVHGEPASVTWSPLPGWRTATVTVDGVALGEAEAASGRWECPSVEAPHRVAVTFQRQSFLIETFADRTLGRLTASAEVPYQDDFPVRWSPNQNALVAGATVDGAPLADEAALAAGEYVFQSVDASHTFAVEFERIPEKALVALTTSGEGEAYVVGTEERAFAPGTDVALGWKAAEGWALSSATLTVTDSEGNAGEPRALTTEELAAGAADRFALDDLQEGCIYQLHVAFEPQVFSIETRAEGSGSITPALSEQWGKSARVSFAPAVGWRVASVTVDGARDEAAAAAGFVQFEGLSADHRVEVVFEQIFHTVSATVSPSAGGCVAVGAGTPVAGTAEASGPVAEGDAARVAWAAAEGWRVKAVTVNGTEQPGLAAGATEYQVGSLAGDLSVAVAVERLRFPVDTALVDTAGMSVGAEAGSISAPLSGDASVLWGDDATVTWELKPGYVVAAVVVDGRELAADEVAALAGEKTFTAVREPHAVRVVVQRDAVEVTGEAVPAEGGVIAAPGRVPWGDDARVSWAPTAGWSVAGVTVDGVALPGETVTAGQVTLPRVSASHQVKATFLKNAYAVAATVRDGAGATAAVTDAAGAPVSAVPHGEGCTFSWQAEPGWRVSDILVNGKSVALTGLFAVADAGQWECPSVEEPTAMEVVCERRTYRVEAEVTPAVGGSATVLPATVPFEGTAVAAWKIQPGWRVASITVDGVVLTAEEAAALAGEGGGAITFASVDRDHRVTVALERDTVAVTAEGRPPEGGTVSAPGTVVWGSAAEVSWQPSEGWHTASVLDNGVPLDSATVARGKVALERATESHRYEVVFQKNLYPLTAQVRDNRGGSAVVSDEDGTPIASVAHGDAFAFSWKADTGWKTADILVNGVSVRESGLFSVASQGTWICPAATSAFDFEVAYERRTYEVAVTGSPAEGGTVSPSGTVAHGDSFPVSYSAAEGWHVSSVAVDGESWPTEAFPEGLVLAPVTADRTVEVTFERTTYPLTLTVSDEAGGTITGPAEVAHGEDATVSWTAKPGYLVTAVTVDGVSRDVGELGGEGGGTLAFPPAEGPHSVAVTVEKRVWPVATATEGNGTVTPSFSVRHGEDATVSWLPEAGWCVREVRVNGIAMPSLSALEAGGAYTFSKVTGPCRLEVVFERRSYLIETFADLNLGTITASASVPYGDDFSVKWSPADGAYVKGVQADGVPVADEAVLAAGAYTFAKVSAPHIFAVEFKALPAKALVAVTSTGGGTAALTGSGGPAFDPGQSAAVGWVPDEGHEVRGATLAEFDADGAAVGEVRSLSAEELAAWLAGSFMVENLVEGHVYRIHVDFAPRQFAIATDFSGEGTCTPSFREDWGKTARVSFAPATGWRVASVTVDGKADEGAAKAGFVAFEGLAGDHRVSVAFEPIVLAAAIAASPAEGGAVAVNGAVGSPAARTQVRWGDPCSFSWEPAAGWRVASVTVNGVVRPGLAAGTGTWALAALQEDVEVAVAFERIPLQVRCSASDGAAVAFSGAGEVLWGDSATVGWKLRPGWHVERVLVNGTEDESLSGADGLVLPSVTEDVTVHVEVARESFEVTTELAGEGAAHGSITASATVFYGDAHTVSWMANPGWRVAQVLIDGVEHGELTGAGARAGYTFTGVVTPHRVQVLLEPVPESFELSVVKTGSVSDRDALGVEKGETVLICWPTEDGAAPELAADAAGRRVYVVSMPGAGHRLKSVTVDGGTEDIKAVGAYAFERVQDAHAITFEFEKTSESDPPKPPGPAGPDDPDDPQPGLVPGEEPAPGPPAGPAVRDPAGPAPAAPQAARDGEGDDGASSDSAALLDRLAQTGDRAALVVLFDLVVLAAAALLLLRIRKGARGDAR